MLTAGREDEQVHKTAILEGLTAGVKSAFKKCNFAETTRGLRLRHVATRTTAAREMWSPHRNPSEGSAGGGD